MTAPRECPPEDQLLDFVGGGAHPDVARRVEEHLADCNTCSALVAEIARGSSSGPAQPRDPSGDEAAEEPGVLAAGAHVGRYVILEPIGAGGMGTVYSARDPSLDRDVALKILKRGTGGPELESRLLREAKAMARLSHPEIVTVFDTGWHGKQLFIAMELLRGGNLRQWLAAAPRTWREVLDVYLHAGRGLARAHAAGIVHRDFKPDNVLVDDEGHARVTDFGLARALEAIEPVAEWSGDIDASAATLDARLTRTGVAVGTPAYMAPEQLEGAADVRSDIFSFCVSLYEGLYGVRPFDGSTLKQLHRAKLSGDVATPLPRRDPAPERLRRVVLTGLRAKPADRIASMDALLSGLERAARAPRRRVVAAVVGGALIVAVGVGALGLRLQSRGQGGGAVGADASAAVEAESQASANPEAAAAYRTGVQAMRDASMGNARKQLDRAIELDPLFAAAHLRRAQLRMAENYGGITPEFAQDIASARASRATLGVHDRLLLEALEPWTLVPPDYAESLRRLQSAMARYPRDADFPFTAGLLPDTALEPGYAARVFDIAVERDPAFALALMKSGFEHDTAGDPGAARRAYTRCLEVSPDSTSCLRGMAELQSREGKCKELAITGRRIVTLLPHSEYGYVALAAGLQGSGAPIDAVRDALAQGREADQLPPADRRVIELADDAALDVLTGDLARAEGRLEELESLSASDRVHRDDRSFETAYTRMLLQLETGGKPRATGIAENYLRRREAWPEGGVNPTMYLLAIQMELGSISAFDLDRRRAAWLAQNRGLPEAQRWVLAYALPAYTRDAALAALALVPDASPLVEADSMRPALTEAVGRTYLLAGNGKEAVSFLSEVASACPSLLPADEVVSTRAAFELGQALEARGDVPSACSAYERVLKRWGKAKPQSTTAALAAGRRAHLSCLAEEREPLLGVDAR